jgi:hypothetical protein
LSPETMRKSVFPGSDAISPLRNLLV